MLFADSRIIPQLLKLMPLSVSNQIAVTSIFTNACKVYQPNFPLPNTSLMVLAFIRIKNIRQSCVQMELCHLLLHC